MDHMGLQEILKTGIWPKCAATTTGLENTILNLQEDIFY